ncbi:MAG: cytochrome c [Ginsengibacter sp.]
MNMFKQSVVSLIFVVYLLTAHSVNAHAQAKWVTPPNDASIKNPYPSDKATIEEGRTLYITNCTPCHGPKGKGNGPAAAALNPKPADHTSRAVQAETDGSLFWKISQGHKPMPQYKPALTDKQRWELVDFIRTLASTSKK